jgi:hypothetical protein
MRSRWWRKLPSASFCALDKMSRVWYTAAMETKQPIQPLYQSDFCVWWLSQADYENGRNEGA